MNYLMLYITLGVFFTMPNILTNQTLKNTKQKVAPHEWEVSVTAPLTLSSQE